MIAIPDSNVIAAAAEKSHAETDKIYTVDIGLPIERQILTRLQSNDTYQISDADTGGNEDVAHQLCDDTPHASAIRR